MVEHKKSSVRPSSVVTPLLSAGVILFGIIIFGIGIFLYRRHHLLNKSMKSEKLSSAFHENHVNNSNPNDNEEKDHVTNVLYQSMDANCYSLAKDVNQSISNEQFENNISDLYTKVNKR